MRQGRKTGHNIIFQRAIDFKDSIFPLRCLINSYFTPRVEQIACVSCCHAQSSVTFGRWKKMAHAHKPRLASNHFSAQVLFKTCTSYSWEHHPSLVGTANPSRLQPGSVGAQGRSNLCLHYAQAIDYFHCLSLPICGHCSGAIMGKHHLFHSLNEDCTVILTD